MFYMRDTKYESLKLFSCHTRYTPILEEIKSDAWQIVMTTMKDYFNEYLLTEVL